MKSVSGLLKLRGVIKKATGSLILLKTSGSFLFAENIRLIKDISHFIEEVLVGLIRSVKETGR